MKDDEKRRTTERAGRVFETPLGAMRVEEGEAGITSLQFVDGRAETGGANPDGRWLAEAEAQVLEYFAGRRRTFDLPLSPSGTPFQERVWSALRDIPYGETRSYQEVAAALGNPMAARAVGLANHNNPILILIPCHRVLGKSGQLAGYAAGPERKRRLLDLEAAR